MPTYEYRCTKCGQHVEAVQKFSDDPLTECGVCGGPLRKVFSPVGIVFKGSGFYRTDSRGSGGKAKKEAAAKEPSKASSGSGSGSGGAGASDSGKGGDSAKSSGSSSTPSKESKIA